MQLLHEASSVHRGEAAWISRGGISVCPRKTSRIGRVAVSHYSGLLGIRPTTDRKTKSETERHSTRRPTRTHACVYCVACVRVRVRVRTCMRMCAQRAHRRRGVRACVSACANVCECVHWTEGATERGGGGGGGRPYPKQKPDAASNSRSSSGSGNLPNNSRADTARSSRSSRAAGAASEQPEQWPDGVSASSRARAPPTYSQPGGVKRRRSQCILAGASAAHFGDGGPGALSVKEACGESLPSDAKAVP